VSKIKDQLEAEIQAHNQIHNQIQAGEEQLAALKEERSQRFGRITILQELAKEEEENRTSAPEVVGGEEIG